MRNSADNIWAHFRCKALARAVRGQEFVTASGWLDEFLGGVAEGESGQFTAEDLVAVLTGRLDLAHAKAGDWVYIERQLRAFVDALLHEYVAAGSLQDLGVQRDPDSLADLHFYQIL